MLFKFRFLSVCLLLMTTFMTFAQETDSGYQVVEVINLELFEGTTRSSIFLSPEGRHYIAISWERLCLYTLPDNEEDACYDLENIYPNLEKGRWSPDGQYFAFIDTDLQNFPGDADVRVLDIAAGEIRNVTDDGFDGNIFDSDFDEASAFTVDIAVAWSENNDLAVLRYPYENGEIVDNTIQVVMVNPMTGESSILIEHEIENRSLYYSFASLARSDNVIAISEVNPPDSQRIYLYDVETGNLLQEIAPSVETLYISSLQFSADNNYLLAYDPTPFSRNRRTRETRYDGTLYIDVSNGSRYNLDQDYFVIQAGFAPEGSAVAYVVHDPTNVEREGLYIASAIGQPAELILHIDYPSATSLQAESPLMWASNNSIMIRDEESNLMLVILEEN